MHTNKQGFDHVNGQYLEYVPDDVFSEVVEVRKLKINDKIMKKSLYNYNCVNDFRWQNHH